MNRPLYHIAAEIRKAWANPSPYALPYLDAMRDLRTMEDKFYYDDARSVVLYFLSNAGGWRGDDAKRIKAELKAML